MDLTATYDVRGEFSDAASQFSPDESGLYLVSIGTRINPGASETTLVNRLQNITDATQVFRGQETITADNGIYSLLGLQIVSLDSAKSYEMQTYANSLSTVKNTNDQTVLCVSRWVIE